MAMTKILVVDDDPAIRSLYTDLLTENGYEVVTASTGDDGVVKVREETPAVVLLDIMMPGKSGLDILKEIKAIDESLPVFLLTAHEQYKRNFASLYADEYFVKGRKNDIILKRIAEVVKDAGE